MIEVTKKCYCDVLSEHNNQLVEGASTYKDINVMIPNSTGQGFHVGKATLDMCPTCYAKYAINLQLTYDNRSHPVYNFVAGE